MFLNKSFLDVEAKMVFLVDGIGAVLSAALLGIILPLFSSSIGLTRPTLLFLAAFPCLFLIYDLFAYFQSKEKWQTMLRVIAIANLLYCLISMFLMVRHYAQLTKLGLTYFIIEIVVILFVVLFEFRVAAQT